jgi:hypothetical protein
MMLPGIGESTPVEDLPSDAMLLGGLAVVHGEYSFKRTPMHEHVQDAGYHAFAPVSAPLTLGALPPHRVVGSCAKAGDTFIVVELRDFDECHLPVLYSVNSTGTVLVHVTESADSRRFTMSRCPEKQRGLAFIPAALRATAIATRPNKGQVPCDIVRLPRL